MRKLGFTLAEVLITLGIIGVIATLTLPTLMSNTAEREYATALKKATSALTEAVQMQTALENISFDEMVDKSDDLDTEMNSLYAFLCNRMQTEKYAAGESDACDENLDNPSGDEPGCLGYGGLMDGNVAMFFRDGSAIIYTAADTIESNECTNAMGETVNCFKVVYDVNGHKKPNMLANCAGQDGRKKNIAGYVNETMDDVDCKADTFVARDQYPIKLYGVGAYPNSPAGYYMFNRK